MNEKGKSKKDGLVIIDKMKKKEKIKEKRKQRVNIMRKPSFRRILAKYMAIGFCVALFIGCVGTYIAVSYYRSVGYKDFVIHTNRMGENILDAYTSSMEKGLVQEDAISSWKSTVRWNLNTKRVMGYEACLYDVSTKEIFVEDYKFDNEWISTRDGSSIVIQPGNTNLEVIIQIIVNHFLKIENYGK